MPKLKELVFIRQATYYGEKLLEFAEAFDNAEDRTDFLRSSDFNVSHWTQIRQVLDNLRPLMEENEDAALQLMTLASIRPGTLERLLPRSAHLELINAGMAVVEYHGNLADSDTMLLLGELLRTRGSIHFMAGEIDDAIANFEQVLELPIEDLPEGAGIRASAASALGDLYRTVGRMAEAEPWLLRAVELAQNEGVTERTIIAARSNLATFYTESGRVDEGMAIYEQILADYGDSALRIVDEAVYHNILIARFRRSRTREDFARLEAYLADVRRQGDNTLLATVLNNMGEALREQGEAARALEYLEEVEAIQKGMENQWMLAYTISTIALCHLQLGNNARATEKLAQASEYFERNDNPLGQAVILNTQSEMARRRGDFHRALEFGRQSLALREQLGRKLEIAKALNNIGTIYYEQARSEEKPGLLDEALQYLNRAKELFDQDGDPALAMMVAANIGEIYRMRGDLRRAHALFSEALLAARRVRNRQAEGNILSNLALVQAARNEIRQARDSFDQAQRIQEDILDGYALLFTLYNRGTIEGDQGDWVAARKYFTQMMNLAVDMDQPRMVTGAAQNLLQCAMNTQPPWDDWIQPFERGLPVLIASGDQDSIRGVSSILINTYLLRQQPQSVIPLADKIIPFAQRIGDHDLQAAMAANTASAYLMLNDTVEACKFLQLLIWLIETYRLDPRQWGGMPLASYRSKQAEICR